MSLKTNGLWQNATPKCGIFCSFDKHFASKYMFFDILVPDFGFSTIIIRD